MNNTEIKEIFYKRYGTSGNFLHYTFTGALLGLLGHSEIHGAPFLSCSLSMGAAMLARRLDGNMVKIQIADSDRHFIYTPSAPTTLFRGEEREAAELLSAMERFGMSGAEILYKSTIPDFLPHKVEFNTSLVRSVLKTRDIDIPPYEEAYIAAGGERIEQFAAAAYHKSGYCTLSAGDVPKSYPLPMTGYKVVSVYCRENDRRRADIIYSAMDKIRGRFPAVRTPLDLSVVHDCWARKNLRDKKAVKYIHHLTGENARISAAVRGLSRCDIKALFRAMNASQSSMERYWGLRNSHAFLARLAADTDGAAAVRCIENGVAIITDSDKVDYLIKMIKNDFEYNIGYKPVFCVTDTI